MKINKKKSLLSGSILIIVIIVSPYFLFLNESIDPELKEINTIFGVITGGYYETIQVYVYWITAKFVPLFLLSILFLTNKNWWAPAILVPISVYLFQLVSVLNDSVEYFDEIEFIYTLPILVPVAVGLFFIRHKISIYIKATDLKKEMDIKMDAQKKKIV